MILWGVAIQRALNVYCAVVQGMSIARPSADPKYSADPSPRTEPSAILTSLLETTGGNIGSDCIR